MFDLLTAVYNGFSKFMRKGVYIGVCARACSCMCVRETDGCIYFPCEIDKAKGLHSCIRRQPLETSFFKFLSGPYSKVPVTQISMEDGRLRL